MRETIHELVLWQQGLAQPVSAPPVYHPNPLPCHPLTGTGGEVTLMSTPALGTALQLVPRANCSADDILQSLSSPSHPSGKFIGLMLLTDII